jgi:hypothetical protein
MFLWRILLCSEDLSDCEVNPLALVLEFAPMVPDGEVHHLKGGSPVIGYITSSPCTRSFHVYALCEEVNPKMQNVLVQDEVKWIVI